MEKEIIWQNGQLVYWEDAKVHVLTHTLHYGGGAYEGIRAYETENGPAIFRLDEHIDRLFYSGEVIGMRIPYSKGQIKQACIELLKH
jgi:branched-chain amino acid aminotransferase